MIRTVLHAALAASLLVFATPAFAHISLETDEAAIGSSFKAVLRVPHGCSGEPTNAIRMQVPEGFIGVKPMPKPGWDLKITRGAYKQSYKLNGAEVSEGVTEVSWSGGNLPDDNYDEFVLYGTVSSALKAGTTIYFPMIQTCPTGEDAWIEIPAEGQGEPEYPAPELKLLKAGQSSH